MDTQHTDIIDKKPTKRKPRGRKIRPREIKVVKQTRLPKLVGYMRVSTENQDHALQQTALLQAGVLEEDIYQDTISGSKISRAGLERCIKALVKGDTLLVWKVDRLSRKLYDMVELMKRFESLGVGFRSLTQPVDTTQPSGRMMMQMLFVFAEFEREMIRERVKEGIKQKFLENPNIQWGRKRSVEYDEAKLRQLFHEGKTIREIAEITGGKKSTIHLICKSFRRKKKNPGD